VLTCQLENTTNTAVTRAISGATVTTGTPYDLVVGGITVTTANQDRVTGKTTWDANTQTNVPEVSYIPADGKLKLYKADLSAPIQLGSSMNSLTIDINGESDITTTDAAAISAEIAAGITFTTSSKGSLNMKRNNGTGLVGSNITLSYNMGLSASIVAPTSASTLTEATEVVIKNPYGLRIGNVLVTSENADDILTAVLGPDHEGSMSFDVSKKILTVNNVGELPVGIESWLDALTIKVGGVNTIYSESGPAISYTGSETGTLTFVKDEDADLSSLTLTSYGINNNVSSKAIEGFTLDNITISDPLQLTSPASMSDILNETTVRIANYNEAYNISIAGTTVTDLNKDDVLGDGKVSFEVSVGQEAEPTYTLTLNGATINGQVKVGIDSLIVDVQNTNSITVSEGNVIKATGAGQSALKIILKTSTADGKLTLTSTSGETIENGGVFSYGFSISIDKTLAMIQPSSTYYLTDGAADYHTARFAPSYGVSIDNGAGGKTDIYEDNAADVYGDGKVSFEKTTHTLTLNNAKVGGISTSLSALDIDVIGNNSIIMGYDGAVFQNPYGKANIAITVKSTAATTGCLSMYLDSNNNSNEGGSSGFLDDNITLAYSNGLDLVSGDLDATYHAYAMIAEPVDYDLFVDNIKVVTANASNITNGINIAGRPFASFDVATNTLTLDSISAYYYWTSNILVRSDIQDLKVKLVSESEVTLGNSTKVFDYTGTASSPKLTLVPVLENSKYGSLTVDGTSTIGDLVGASGYTFNNEFEVLNQVTPDTETGWKVQLLGSSEIKLYYLESFGITITTAAGSYPITSVNRKNVLNDSQGEETVQFDGIKTLMLNGATLQSINIANQHELQELVIYLKGNNTINNNDNNGIIYGGDPNLPLTYATGDGSTTALQPGTLECSYYVQDAEHPEVMNIYDNFSSVTYNNNLSENQNTTDHKIKVDVALTPIITKEQPEVTNEGDAGKGIGEDIQQYIAAHPELNTTEKVTAAFKDGVTIKNILYILASDDGRDETDITTNVLNLNTKMDDATASVLASDLKDSGVSPSSDYFTSKFKGLCFLLPAGSGEIKLNLRTNEYGEVHVMIGSGAAIPISTEIYQDYTIGYSVTEDTYVLIYSVADPKSSSRPFAAPRAPGRKMTTTTQIKSVGVRASRVSSAPEPPLSPKSLSKSDITLSNGSYVSIKNVKIDDAEAGNVAEMDYDVFEDIKTNDTPLTYVDLSQTALTGLTVDRTKLPWRNLPATTFIYLPVGNKAKADEKNVIIGSVSDDVEFMETGAFETPMDFTATKATLKRDFSEKIGKKCSIFLPFALDEETAAELGTFYQMAPVSAQIEGKIVMEPVEKTVANVPYMFKPAKEAISVNMVEVLKTIPDPTAVKDVFFEGTFEEKTVMSDSDFDVYCFMGDQFVRVKDDPVTLSPFRSYMYKVASSSLSNELDIDWGDGTTSIKNMKVGIEDNIYYDLQGRRVLYPQKGIYIVNGKKVILK
jgi:hypothetical protein